jgi:ubiquitin C-terminal hydrolase
MSENYGIMNFSNNCYLNVIIQILLKNENTKRIIDKHLEYKDNIINPMPVMKLLSDTLNCDNQNDSQETITLLTDKLPELDNYITNKVKYYYKCNICQTSRSKSDSILTFSVFTENVEDSIKNLVNTEQHKLECDNCSKKLRQKTITNTTKTCKIKKLGDIIIFINILKIKLDIAKTITFNNDTYILTGLIKHYGSQNFGHYIFIDLEKNILINDTKISEISKKDINYDDIYLFFYTKKTK